jgi:REP element-mobilizing transposase RayT
MPRSLRIEFPGAYYRVMARGNRRETIFHDDDDRRFFLATLSGACAMTGWRVHAWVLMGNHYHLFIETPEANLVAGMSWLQNTVTRRYNVRHQAWGRLFGDRYKAVLVEGADTSRRSQRMWMPGAAICGAVGIGVVRSSPEDCASLRES